SYEVTFSAAVMASLPETDAIVVNSSLSGTSKTPIAGPATAFAFGGVTSGVAGALPATPGGAAGSAVTLSSGYLDIPEPNFNNYLNQSGAITLAAWIKVDFTTVNGIEDIISHGYTPLPNVNGTVLSLNG